jgi:hypothetical protein
MKIPQMPVLQDQSKVYSPTSGVNLSKLPNEIDDGQNALMLNMWYRDTMLRTRPGLVKEIEQTYGKIIDVYPHNSDGNALLNKTTQNGTVILEQYGFYIITETNIVAYSNGAFVQIPISATHGTSWAYTYESMNFSHCTIADSQNTNISMTDGDGNIYVSSGIHFYIIGAVFASGNSHLIDIGNYMFSTMTGINYYNINSYYYCKKILLDVDWFNHSDMNYIKPSNLGYIPTIYTNMKASGAGDKLEARNYINPAVRNEFVTDTTSELYHLADQDIDNTRVLIEIDPGPEEDHYEFAANITSVAGDQIITLDRLHGTITLTTALAETSQVVPNLIVTYSKTVYTEPTPIMKCNISSWFGGAYQGQVSGDSIFVAGNPDEPNAVYHSAVGDPTYWPDDSADYVGSPSDSITAFGKNFGKLFIFKQNSVYEKSFYWDSVSQKQSFPTSEVHIGIGCDMPNSVQLINNNLTWANSKGGVYTVATTNTNNERVIVPISQNINPDLLKNSLADLQAAVSVDDGFYYYLFVGTKVYLWDYNSTAFIDCSDILKAQNRLAWYIWATPCTLTTAFLYGGKVWGASATDNFLYAFDPLQSLDEGGAWFDAYLTSKAFDNGLPQFKKQPYYYVFNMACAGVVGIEIQLIDEVDTCSILETIEGGDSEAMTSISLRQAMSWGKTYQVAVHRLNGDTGAWAVTSYSIKSKIGKEV